MGYGLQPIAGPEQRRGGSDFDVGLVDDGLGQGPEVTSNSTIDLVHLVIFGLHGQEVMRSSLACPIKPLRVALGDGDGHGFLGVELFGGVQHGVQIGGGVVGAVLFAAGAELVAGLGVAEDLSPVAVVGLLISSGSGGALDSPKLLIGLVSDVLHCCFLSGLWPVVISSLSLGMA